MLLWLLRKRWDKNKLKQVVIFSAAKRGAQRSKATIIQSATQEVKYIFWVPES
jgi:hypothetical protein